MPHSQPHEARVSRENLEALIRVCRAAAGPEGNPFLRVLSDEATQYLRRTEAGHADPAHGGWLCVLLEQGVGLATVLCEIIEGVQAMLSADLAEAGHFHRLQATDMMAALADDAEQLRRLGTELLLARAQVQKASDTAT